MADVKEKKEKVVKKSDVSREEFDNLAAKVRLISNNWHKYCAKYIGGGAKNGSIDGHAKISGLLLIAVVAIAGIVLGSGEILDYSSGNNGTVRINRVSAGVNSMEADTFIGAVTGNVTGDVTGNVTVSGTADGNITRGVLRAGIAAGDLGVGTNSLGVTIPDNAVVFDGYVDMTTAFLGAAGSTTVALELNGSADILAAVTYTNGAVWNSTGIKAIIPVGTAATAVKMTGDRTLQLVIGNAALTQGVGTVIIEYDLIAN